MAAAFVAAIVLAPVLHHGERQQPLSLGSIPQLKESVALADTPTAKPSRSHTRGRGRPIPKQQHHRHYTWYTDKASYYNQWPSRACGGYYAPGNMGVASRDYPCGTKVRFRYHGRKLDAWVVDWGPAAWTGRKWDLSEEVNNALGYTTDDWIDWRIPKNQ